MYTMVLPSAPTRRLAAVCWVVLLAAIPVLPRSGVVHAASGREPVIVIPGVAGSEFTAASSFRLSVDDGHGGVYTRTYNTGEKVWVNAWEAIALGPDDYFDALKLQPDGTTPVAPALQVSGLYGSAYDDLVGYLQRQGYVLNVDLWLFPYDWRKDVRTTASQLDTVITTALVVANGGRTDPASWTIHRADLIGHSMGGLVGRNYVADPGRAARVDQLITLGTPQLGATKFLKALIYGDDFGPSFLGIGLNSQEVRDVVQNMPGGWQLLPSRQYYALYNNGDTNRLSPYVEDRDVDGNGVAWGQLDYDGPRSTEQLLLNMRKNATAMSMARTWHDAIDGQRIGDLNGVRWSALVGYGTATLGQIREYTGSCWSWFRYVSCAKRDETPVDGDGTVAVMSAAMGDPWRNILIESGAQISFLRRGHGDLVKRDYVLGVATGEGPALTWIGDTLRGSQSSSASPSPPGVRSLSASVAPQHDAVARAPQHQLDGIWISALGPVAIQVRDNAARTTGRRAGAADAVVAIPDTRYEQLPDAQFVFARGDDTYVITLGAEQAGSTDLKLRVLGGGRVQRTAVYLGVALGAGGRAELHLGGARARASAPQAWPSLAVDAEGDGVFERHVPASAVLDELASVDTEAPTIAADIAMAGRSLPVLRWHAADAGAGLFLETATLDPDGPNSRSLANGERLVLAPGTYRVVVLAVDRAGNAASRELSFTAR